MKIDINSLGRNPSEYAVEFGANEIEPDDALLKLNNALSMSVQASRVDSKIELTGQINAEVVLNCSRCLTAVNKEFDVAFRSIFVLPEEFPDAKELELEEADLDIDIFEGEEIDLANVAREHLLLELPETIVCSRSCKGLCEVCGIDRNKETCECGADNLDPRWAALKNLK